ncbi:MULTISPECIES: hypothetical protein [Bradyrhizobium]|uniref:hypothetical protein n=1 Tax=Bradyrhizobium pachyrhizi TaxID=280333 RepID=UPI002AA56D7A
MQEVATEPDQNDYYMLPEEALPLLPEKWRNNFQSMADTGSAALVVVEKELLQLSRMSNSFTSLVALKHAQKRLPAYKFDTSMDAIMELDMLTTAFVVAYARAVEGLMRLADERQTYMRENDLQNWPMHGRVALVIDEFAEVQSAIDTANEKEEKARAKRLAANLVSLARRARALGIHIVIAAQRHTTDSVDSALLNNLNWRLVMRQGARHTARALLDLGDDLDSLSVMPTELPTGQFYAYDTSTGDLKLLQAHIAPGVVFE